MGNEKSMQTTNAAERSRAEGLAGQSTSSLVFGSARPLALETGRYGSQLDQTGTEHTLQGICIHTRQGNADNKKTGQSMKRE
jgi:hypothetical protein